MRLATRLGSSWVRYGRSMNGRSPDWTIEWATAGKIVSVTPRERAGLLGERASGGGDPEWLESRSLVCSALDHRIQVDVKAVTWELLE